MNTASSELEIRRVITLDGCGAQERLISTRINGHEPREMFAGFPPASSQIAAQLVFGGCRFEKEARARVDGAGWPLLWVQGDGSSGNQIVGVQTFELEGCSLRRVTAGDRVIGTCWSDSDADYCLLAGVLPTDPTAHRSVQTRSCFQQIEAALQQADMDFSHIVRTWFYLDKLLAWYDEFNTVRTAFFQSRGVFNRLLPASTGIGAGNPAGAALTAGVLAVRPRHNRVQIQTVTSPRQGPATAYCSSFSRAVELAFPTRRQLIISGTASITPGGKTAFAGNPRQQMHLTLEVVEALLKARGMDWSHATRAVGYFQNIRALDTFDACCRERHIPPLPMAPAHAAICRSDLLFELEIDAVVSATMDPQNSVAKGTTVR